MKSILIILFSFISLKGLSQTNLEMVPSGDFSQYDDYEIPIEYWFSNYNKDFIIKYGYIINILKSRYDSEGGRFFGSTYTSSVICTPVLC